jgi:hypothetical protein
MSEPVRPRYDRALFPITTSEIQDGAITKAKAAASFIQCGRTSKTFAFAATGAENQSASITFPTAFAAAPAVVACVEGIDAHIVKIAVTATGFTITVRDDAGTDYTTSQTATVNWIAVAV